MCVRICVSVDVCWSERGEIYLGKRLVNKWEMYRALAQINAGRGEGVEGGETKKGDTRHKPRCEETYR